MSPLSPQLESILRPDMVSEGEDPSLDAYVDPFHSLPVTEITFDELRELAESLGVDF
jgi:hypothetical protein